MILAYGSMKTTVRLGSKAADDCETSIRLNNATMAFDNGSRIILQTASSRAERLNNEAKCYESTSVVTSDTERPTEDFTPE
jgi:hypothetical protein